MHSGPTGATYLPDLDRLPYPVEDLGYTDSHDRFKCESHDLYSNLQYLIYMYISFYCTYKLGVLE